MLNKTYSSTEEVEEKIRELAYIFRSNRSQVIRLAVEQLYQENVKKKEK